MAFNPGTPLEWMEPLLEEIDMVVILGVDPGWGGQRLAANTLSRIARAKELIARSGKEILVCADGGITKENIGDVAAAGADLVVTGSAVFDGKAAEANARFMLETMRARSRRS